LVKASWANRKSTIQKEGVDVRRDHLQGTRVLQDYRRVCGDFTWK
jgi:hypothetical protein